MSASSPRLHFLRQVIPDFACQPGCHDCCGPVTAASEEMARLPEVDEAVRAAALAEWNCPYLGENGCQVYGERPLICRLFGTTPAMPCPNGCRPASWVDPRVEARIHRYLATTRQILL